MGGRAGRAGDSKATQIDQLKNEQKGEMAKRTRTFREGEQWITRENNSLTLARVTAICSLADRAFRRSPMRVVEFT